MNWWPGITITFRDSQLIGLYVRGVKLNQCISDPTMAKPKCVSDTALILKLYQYLDQRTNIHPIWSKRQIRWLKLTIAVFWERSLLLLSLHCETNGDMMAGVSRLLRSVLPTLNVKNQVFFVHLDFYVKSSLVNAKCQKVPVM